MMNAVPKKTIKEIECVKLLGSTGRSSDIGHLFSAITGILFSAFLIV